MPIYSGLGSMEDLRKAAFVEASLLLAKAQLKSLTGDEALDSAVGYIAFAREEPRLFQFIVSGKKDIGARTLDSLAVPETRDDSVIQSWIFTHGLAHLLAEGTLVMDEAEITRRLGDAGGAFYLYGHRKEGRAV